MFAVDDELESSPKFEALDALPPHRRARAFEAWVRLGAACRKRGNGGLVTVALADKILHTWKPIERAQALVDLVEARGGRACGLLVAEGEAWRFHEWSIWQPDEEEASEERATVSKKTLRQRRWRHKRRLGVDPRETDRSSTEASTVDASDRLPETSTGDGVDATRAHARVRDARAFPDPVPIPTHPDLDHGGVVPRQVAPPAPTAPPSPPALSEVAALTRDAEIIRSTAQAAFREAGVDAPRAVRDLDGKPWVALVEPVRERAQRDGASVVDVARALLEGFLASERAKARGYPIGFLVANPAEYLTTRTEPTANLQRLLEGIPKSATTTIPADEDPFNETPKRSKRA